MKRDKIIYWITTGLLSAGMLMSGFMYLTNPELAKGFATLGFPVYFMMILGVAKLAGAIALVIPPVPAGIKEWAYAGFAFTFIGAVITHLATNTPWFAPLIFLGLLVVSYFYFRKANSLTTA